MSISTEWGMWFGGLLLGMALGGWITQKINRQEAVNAGVAEYVVVGQGPKTEFRWKEPK